MRIRPKDLGRGRSRFFFPAKGSMTRRQRHVQTHIVWTEGDAPLRHFDTEVVISDARVGIGKPCQIVWRMKRIEAKGLSNLMSGLLVWGWSVILGVPVDIDAVGGCPVLVDLGEDGGDEADQGLAVGEDADLLGSSLDFLLDGALDGV